MSSAVLVHGCHLQADLNGKKWEDIVWAPDANGIPTLYGRATMGLKKARDLSAEILVFSTGASEIDGVKEGEYTYRYALDHADVLWELLGFPSRQDYSEWLEEVRVLDIVSQNTTEECSRNFRMCATLGITQVTLVSSPWHIERSHAEALKVAEEMRAAGETVPEIQAVASYGSTEGIVILEPPHRGDRPKTNWHILCRRLFRVPESLMGVVEREIEQVLDENEA